MEVEDDLLLVLASDNSSCFAVRAHTRSCGRDVSAVKSGSERFVSRAVACLRMLHYQVCVYGVWSNRDQSIVWSCPAQMGAMMAAGMSPQESCKREDESAHHE